MLVKDIPASLVPSLQIHDTVAVALQRMLDEQYSQLPVADGDTYVGLVTEEQLLEQPDDQIPLASLTGWMTTVSVQPEQHLIYALSLAAAHQLKVVPVTGEEHALLGVIDQTALLQWAAGFLNGQDPGALIVLERESNQYAFSEINQLVETNDAQIMQLNTGIDAQTGLLQITIRINKQEVSDLIATFQRHDYTVRFYMGEEQYANELRSNYEHLMHYLKI